jgi:hypothetical protein
MPSEICIPVLDGAPCPETRSVIIAFNAESNAVIFREREGGALLYEWITKSPDSRSVAELFADLASQAWATVEVLRSAARVVCEALELRTPGRVTLQEELTAILRARGNEWMTTAELAAEVNRRGRHWKTDRNRITAAKVLGRTKLYARTFERAGERVRLHAG